MKIAMNCVGWAEDMRGVDRYYVELLNALLKIDDRNTYIIFTGAWQKYMDRFLGRANVRLIPIRWSSHRVLRNLWHALILPELVKKYNADVVHLPNTMPLFMKDRPTVCTIHDLLEYTYPRTFGFLQIQLRRVIVQGETVRADHIIAVSDLTAQSLREILKVPMGRITTIYSGVNQDIFHPSDQGYTLAQKRFKLRQRYILFVSGIDRKKNALGLIQAYYRLPHSLQSEYQLIFAGKPDNAYKELQAAIWDMGLQNRVLLLGQVNDDLPILYQGASLFVMPSFYEGFGLPILEAMASGVPVIASKEVAIAQKLSSYCRLIDPYRIDDLAQALNDILSSSDVQKRYSNAGLVGVQEYTWEKSAFKTLSVYEKALRCRNDR